MAFSAHDTEKGLEDPDTSRTMADTPSIKNESSGQSEASSTPQIPGAENMGSTAPVPTVLDWDGPDDPGIYLIITSYFDAFNNTILIQLTTANPMNWPMWSRCYHTIIPALFGFTV